MLPQGLSLKLLAEMILYSKMSTGLKKADYGLCHEGKIRTFKVRKVRNFGENT